MTFREFIEDLRRAAVDIRNLAAIMALAGFLVACAQWLAILGASAS